MRIIFLDIDGVLNNRYTKERSNRGFIGIDPAKVRLLKEMQETSGAVIVLTSTWRDDWEPVYEKCGPEGKYLTDRLADGGVQVHDKIPGFSGLHRGAEIRRYAKESGCRSFIVLDDEQFPDFTLNGIRDHGPRINWIHTRLDAENGGLQPEHVPMVLKLFEQQEENQNSSGSH